MLSRGLRAITVGRQRVGVSVQIEVSVLREECRLPFGVIQRYLQGRYGLHLSVGELVALVRGVAVRGRREYAQLQQEIRASGVVHGDETGWRENGRNGYLWSFSTPKVRYLLYRPSRVGAAVEEVLGEEFDGVLVSDFYGAYNVYQGPHQRCWVHLLRAMHQLKERYPQEAAVAAWTQGVREVSGRAQAYPGSDPRLPGVVQQAQRVTQQREYEQELWALCQPHVKTQAPMRVLCQRVERFLPELFTFVAEQLQPVQDGVLVAGVGGRVGVGLVQGLDGVLRDGLHPWSPLLPQAPGDAYHRVGGAVAVGEDAGVQQVDSGGAGLGCMLIPGRPPRWVRVCGTPPGLCPVRGTIGRWSRR